MSRSRGAQATSGLRALKLRRKAYAAGHKVATNRNFGPQAASRFAGAAGRRRPGFGLHEQAQAASVQQGAFGSCLRGCASGESLNPSPRN
jgi:hypothetical protein